MKSSNLSKKSGPNSTTNWEAEPNHLSHLTRKSKTLSDAVAPVNMMACTSSDEGQIFLRSDIGKQPKTDKYKQDVRKAPNFSGPLTLPNRASANSLSAPTAPVKSLGGSRDMLRNDFLGHAWFYDMIHGGGRTEITQTTDQVKRIVDLGGMIGVILGQGPLKWVAEWRPKNEGDTFIPHGCGESSQSFAQTYLWLKDLMGDRAYDGQMTIGTDFNGFAHMPGARFGDKACYGGNSDVVQPESTKVQYPFKLDPDLVPAATSNGVLPDMELYQFQSRVFDFNYDGAGHMGMMPDLLEDLRQQGMKRSDLEPVYRSAEYFVNMWERAILAGGQIPPAGAEEVLADETVEAVDDAVAAPASSSSISTPVIATVAAAITLAVLVVIAFLAFRVGKERGVRETLISSPFTLDV